MTLNTYFDKWSGEWLQALHHPQFCVQLRCALRLINIYFKKSWGTWLLSKGTLKISTALFGAPLLKSQVPQLYFWLRIDGSLMGRSVTQVMGHLLGGNGWHFSRPGELRVTLFPTRGIEGDTFPGQGNWGWHFSRPGLTCSTFYGQS